MPSPALGTIITTSDNCETILNKTYRETFPVASVKLLYIVILWVYNTVLVELYNTFNPMCLTEMKNFS